MTLECINPKDLPTPQTYTQVVVATGSKMVFVSGQEPEDIHGKLVGLGDLATQARQVFGNLGRALAAAGARPAQVTRITIYVVNYKRDECLPIIEKARIALFGDHKPADVVLGVATLSPDYLIEVDAIAIIDLPYHRELHKDAVEHPGCADGFIWIRNSPGGASLLH